jgi:hypothetical protein
MICPGFRCAASGLQSFPAHQREALRRLAAYTLKIVSPRIKSTGKITTNT